MGFGHPPEFGFIVLNTELDVDFSIKPSWHFAGSP